MLAIVPVVATEPSRFAGLVPTPRLLEVAALAEPFRGARVLHVTSTRNSPAAGTARAVVALGRGLGLLSDWRTTDPPPEHLAAGGALRAALRGHGGRLDPSAFSGWLEHAVEAGRRCDEQYDFVFVHDPEPAGILALRGPGRARWVWSCGVDLSGSDRITWQEFQPFLREYDAVALADAGFGRADLPGSEVLPPCIDAFAPANLDIRRQVVDDVARGLGVDPSRPLLLQAGAGLSGAQATVAAWRTVRQLHPGVQLVLIVESPEVAGVRAVCADDDGALVLALGVDLGPMEVGALRRLARCVVHDPGGDDFGLPVLEAAWAGAAVVTTRSVPAMWGAAAPLQGGTLAERLLQHVAGPDRDAAGERERLRIAAGYLAPSRLGAELGLMRRLAEARPLGPAAPDTDPVCGMTIDEPAPAWITFAGQRFVFCSQGCRQRFAADPAGFAVRARGASAR